MNLEVVVEKLKTMAENIQAEKGPLELFGLFLRDDSPDLWDVVVAAPWLEADERESFVYIADLLRSHLSDEERFWFSRIVILDHGGAVLDSFLKEFGKRIGLAEVHYVAAGGAVIRRAYIIVAQSLAKEASRRTAKKSPRPKAG